MGFNSVRLPIGYWNVIHDPYAKYAPANHRDSLAVIDWCFDICEKVTDATNEIRCCFSSNIEYPLPSILSTIFQYFTFHLPFFTPFFLLLSFTFYHFWFPWNLITHDFNSPWYLWIFVKLGLTVLLDLHGAPGSQNGIDHSGCSMIPKW